MDAAFCRALSVAHDDFPMKRLKQKASHSHEAEKNYTVLKSFLQKKGAVTNHLSQKAFSADRMAPAPSTNTGISMGTVANASTSKLVIIPTISSP
eukprot:1739354-Rhodomonas_salina.4